MLLRILYQKDHKRKPVRLGDFYLFRDPQASIPTSWCDQCGCEIFEKGTVMCPQCRKLKGVKEFYE